MAENTVQSSNLELAAIEESLWRKRVVDLRSELKARGESTAGTKKHLVERLANAMLDDPAIPSTTSPPPPLSSSSSGSNSRGTPYVYRSSILIDSLIIFVFRHTHSLMLC